jgi:AcrR family transcriptional regulator
LVARRQNTRDDLLNAGISLYQRLSSSLLRGLTAGDVATEAGYHRQTFYRYWDTQAAYVSDLIRHVLALAGAADGVEILPDRRSKGLSPEDLVRDIARYDYRKHAEDPVVALRIGLLSMQALEGAELSDLAQSSYDADMDRVAEGFAELLADWGREPIAPLATRDLARLQQALLTGLLLQDQTATDHPSPGALYEIASARILLALTQSTK